ncbi:MAG: hypothetical protein V1648_00545, partial [Candidatus Aenigmatarchaeota archaeon]
MQNLKYENVRLVYIDEDYVCENGEKLRQPYLILDGTLHSRLKPIEVRENLRKRGLRFTPTQFYLLNADKSGKLENPFFSLSSKTETLYMDNFVVSEGTPIE